MKLIRSVVLGVVFLLGVFLASANTGLVDLVYLPALPFAGLGEAASLRVPTFIVVLGSILVGVIGTGLGVFVEQSKLRWATRAAVKKARQKEKEWEGLRDELAGAKQELANARQELAVARAETTTARERLAQTEGRLAKLREERRSAAPAAAAGTPAAAVKASPSARRENDGNDTSGRG